MEEELKIPEIEVSENKVVLPILEVPVIFNKETKMVKLQKLSSGKRRNALKKHINASIRGNQISGSIDDPIGVQITLLSEIIIDAPFDFSVKGLESLPEGVIEYLYQQYQNWTKKKA